MIRPLRRRHRWLIPTLLALVVIGTGLALAYPMRSSRSDALPQALASP